MTEELCNKMIQKPGMDEPRPCIYPKKHRGKHSPDLTGTKIHNYLILRRAPNYIFPSTGGIAAQWWIRDQFGHERIIRGSHMTGGKTRGIINAKYSGFGTRTKEGKPSPEYQTVLNHHARIFNPKNPDYETNKGTPFCDDWNPDKGGAYWKGAQWIIKNLGKRPSRHHSLDVIEHHKGFMPGNLRWTLRDIQANNKKHKTMFLLTIEQHEEALRQLGYGIYKLKETNG